MWYDLECHIISLLLLDCYVLPSLTKVIVVLLLLLIIITIIIFVDDDNDNDFVLFSSIYFF